MTRLAMLAVLSMLSAPALAADPVVLNPAALFPEGPVMAGDRLIYAQYAGQEVTVWDGTANATLWKEAGCGPSAVVPVAAGYAVTCYDSAQIVVISADGAEVARYKADAGGAGLVGPNDGTPDGAGGAWLTLSGPWESGPIVGRVVHLGADGSLKPAADDLHYANGIALGADGRLYVNESEAARVISFAVGADGTLGDRRLFARMGAVGEDASAYPDGLKLGPNGNFFVGLYSAGAVVELKPDGTLAARHAIAATATPNMTFSADGRTMYVMAVDNTAAAPYEGRVLAVALP